MITKRTLLTASAGLVVAPLVSHYAHAAEFTLKYASDRPSSHPAEIEAVHVTRRIKEETGGRVEFQLFPNNQLGGQADMLSQLRSGAIQFFNVSGLLISPLVPVAAIHGLGFIFKDYDAVWRAMDGDLGRLVKTAIRGAGLDVQEKIWDSGFRQVTTATKPIATAADLQGFKIRVPVAPMWVSLFRSLGASPASISANELYSSLQTRIVDGQENPLPVIEAFKLYEVQRYCSLTNHLWDGYWVLANRRAFNRIPETIREIISKNWDIGAENERKANLEATLALQKGLQDRGVAFNETNAESFREKLKSSDFYGEWRKTFGNQAWSVLEQYTGSLS